MMCRGKTVHQITFSSSAEIKEIKMTANIRPSKGSSKCFCQYVAGY